MGIQIMTICRKIWFWWWFWNLSFSVEVSVLLSSICCSVCLYENFYFSNKGGCVLFKWANGSLWYISSLIQSNSFHKMSNYSWLHIKHFPPVLGMRHFFQTVCVKWWQLPANWCPVSISHTYFGPMLLQEATSPDIPKVWWNDFTVKYMSQLGK